jgi:hypothetical protein
MTGGPVMPPPVSGRPSAPRRRCVRHDEREAVGRCTECEGAFCRECLTEHEDRLYCGPCFASKINSGKKKTGRRRDWRRVRAIAVTAGSLVCLTAGFYLLGRALAVIPPDVHDGTVWEKLH